MNLSGIIKSKILIKNYFRQDMRLLNMKNLGFFHGALYQDLDVCHVILIKKYLGEFMKNLILNYQFIKNL